MITLHPKFNASNTCPYSSTAVLLSFPSHYSTLIKLFQPLAAFHIETSHLVHWFLYERQHWAEMGYYSKVSRKRLECGLPFVQNCAKFCVKLRNYLWWRVVYMDYSFYLVIVMFSIHCLKPRLLLRSALPPHSASLFQKNPPIFFC